jgi:hypothetical protein
MAAGFRCPNPSCNYSFPPDAVRSASRLVCPRCAQVFEFRPQAVPAPGLPSAPAPAFPGARTLAPPVYRAPSPPATGPTISPLPLTALRGTLPVAPQGVAPPLSPTSPPLIVTGGAVPEWLAEMGPTGSTGTVAAEPGKVVETPRKSPTPRIEFPPVLAAFLRHWPAWQLVVVALLFVGGCGFYTAAGLLLTSGKSKSAGSKGKNDEAPYEFVFQPAKYNFKFTCRNKDWQRVELEGAPSSKSSGSPSNSTPSSSSQPTAVAADGLQPILLLKRRKPNSAMAICVHDFRGRRPNEANLDKETILLLKAGFMGLKSRTQLAQFGGRDAWRVEFQGDHPTDKFVVGECYSIVHEAVVYWLITWRPAEGEKADGDKIVAEWDELREGFELLPRASGEPPGQEKTKFEGAHPDKAAFGLYVLDRLGKKDTTPQDKDVDLALFGTDAELAQLRKRPAEVRVRLLDKQPDAAKAVDEEKKRVEEFIKKRWKSEDVAVVPEGDVKDTEVGRDKLKGQLLKLHVTVSAPRYEAFFRIILLPKEDHLLIVECECDWDLSGTWDSDFEQLIESLYFKSKD